MKTKLSLQAAECTFDDVIFSNRNQAYGAYDLRKTYNKHLMLALLFVTFLFISGATSPIIYRYLFPHTDNVKPPEKQTTTTITLGPDFKIPEIKPPDLNKTMAGVLNHASTGQYRPVDTLESNVDQTQIFINDQPVIDTTGIEGPIVFVPQTQNDIVPVDETIYTYVEEPATFQGGNIESFRNWVINNYVYPPSAIENRVEGKVNLNFVVDQNGDVSDINIVRSAHQMLSEETIKVISTSPKWQPAKQNGKFVKQRFSMLIKLELQ